MKLNLSTCHDSILQFRAAKTDLRFTGRRKIRVPGRTLQSFGFLKLFTLLIIITLFHFSLLSQVRVLEKGDKPTPNILYRLAKQLANQGKIEEALKIYENLYRQYPGNLVYRQSYWNLLKSTRRFDTLRQEMFSFLQKHPGDMKVRVSLGELYYLLGDTILAAKFWQEAIKNSRNKRQAYRLIFLTLYSQGDLQRGLRYVRTARSNLNRPDFMAFDLANIYKRAGEYRRALQEYLLILKYNPGNLNFVSRNLLTFPPDSGLFTFMDSVLQREESQHQLKSPIVQLRYELYLKNRRFNMAYQLASLLDSLKGSQGKFLLKFAREILNEQEYQLVSQVLLKLLREGSDELKGEALLTLATVFERKWIDTYQKDSPLDYFLPDNQVFQSPLILAPDSGQKDLQRAFHLYDSLATSITSSRMVNQARIRLGNLLFRVLQDYDNAYLLFQQVYHTTRKNEEKLYCLEQMSEIQFARGDVEKSTSLIRTALEQSWTGREERFRKELLFLLWKQRLISGTLEKADIELFRVDTLFSPGSELYNDILETNSLLEIFGQDKLIFERYLKAEWLIQQGKLSEATEWLQHLSQTGPESPTLQLIRFRLITLLLQFEHYEEAATLADSILASDFIFNDRVAYVMGCYARDFLQSREETSRWFDYILTEYPTSIFIDEVRKTLRMYQ